MRVPARDEAVKAHSGSPALETRDARAAPAARVGLRRCHGPCEADRAVSANASHPHPRGLPLMCGARGGRSFRVPSRCNRACHAAVNRLPMCRTTEEDPTAS